MALFTDGSISSIEDLQGYDSLVLEAAQAEQVDLSVKMAVAQSEIAIELEEFIRRRRLQDPLELGETEAGVERIVVTEPLRRWHSLLTLTLLYGDIQSNHVSSRYSGKWKEYRQRAIWAAEMLFRIGVGFVNDPIPKAKPPEVRLRAGSLEPRTYRIRVAWRNSAGQTGAPSDEVIYRPEIQGVIAVKALEGPANASGYDVYAGTDEAAVTKQNTATVPPTEEWVMPETGLISGAGAPTGQKPDWYLRNDRVLQRG